MNEDCSVFERQMTCDHAKYRSYTQRHFDILHGFELIYARCLNCHKVLNLETRGLS